MATEDQDTENLGDKAKDALDDVAGAGTANKVEGGFKETIGEAKSSFGQATDNAELQGEAEADKLEGKTQQAAGEAESIGEKIGDFVEDAKDAIGGFFNKVKDALDGDDEKKDAV